MRRTLLAPLLLLLLTLGPVAALGFTIQREVIVHLLAVDATGRGKVIDARIWVEIPGSDLFIAKPAYGVSEDTVLSARLALFYASLLADVDPLTINGGFEIIGREEVSGASGGLAFAVTYYSLIKGVYINTSHVALTGLLQPNGMVAAVGGVEAKVEAASKLGISEIVAPVASLSRLRVNSTKVGIVPVCSVAHALELVLSSPNINSANITLRSSVFKESAFELLELLNETIRLFGDELGEHKAIITDGASVANTLYNEGKYYAAASIAYSTLVMLLEVLPSGSLDNFTKLILSKVNRTAFAEKLLETKNSIAVEKKVPLWRLEALLAADYRFYAASKLLMSSNPRDKALGALRLLTAKHWLDASTRLTGPLIDQDVFKRSVRLLVTYADLSVKYLESLVKGAQVKIENPEKLGLDELRRDMNAAYIQGDDIRAAALALNALALVAQTITQYDIVAGADPVHEAICGLKQTMLHESIAGLKSFMTSMLVEYATSAPTNITRAIMASQAATYSLLPLVMKVVSAHVQQQPGAYSPLDDRLVAVIVIAMIVGSGSVIAALSMLKKIE
ncbi:hypothetical protein Pyrfu_0138 [Pyrolobus fumarii 1A]|uniref:Lon proteolytic domain-containing protein n=1 Tax=Pyrolobus fumarii (strain DSM 11204 / 1A) TaxID=694429 RepID=G0EEG9_PYRF1|nr:S16 family serine protease [Pyrolobus fumarii]AEM38010.1 hypothetical protein Pyrfu_0138 [Pyrolobus fumarii 1A]